MSWLVNFLLTYFLPLETFQGQNISKYAKIICWQRWAYVLVHDGDGI